MMNTKELIFNIYKDEVVYSKKFKAEVIDKFEVTKREATDLYARITNYQIKKYGSKLDYREERVTKEQSNRIAQNARQRRYDKLNCWERQYDQHKKRKKGEL